MTTTGERTEDECTAMHGQMPHPGPRPNKIFSWTVDRLPRDARQKKDSGLPFGAFVSPFGEMKKRRTLSSEASVTKKREEAAKIARCNNCFGYVNAFCTFDEDGFNCALCGHGTKWKNERERERYKRVTRYINSRNEDDPLSLIHI